MSASPRTARSQRSARTPALLHPSQLAPGEIYEMATDARDRLAALAGELDPATDNGPITASHVAELAAALVTAFPPALVRAVHRYRTAGSPHDVLLLRGLQPADPPLAPTPATATPGDVGSVARRAGLTLLGVLSLLGEPFTFASLYEGRLIQHVTPAPGQENAQTSEGSDSFLDWHVEDAHTDQRCDYFGLLCLRGDPAATTLFAPVRGTVLDPRWTTILREPRFLVEPDVAHGSPHGGSAEPHEQAEAPLVPVLAGDPGDLEIRIDSVYLRARSGDPDAAAALAHLTGALQAAARGHVLEPGDLLIVDNRRVAHARTAFRPRFDGTDRWLLRAMTCASARAHRRRGARHAL